MGSGGCSNHTGGPLCGEEKDAHVWVYFLTCFITKHLHPHTPCVAPQGHSYGSLLRRKCLLSYHQMGEPFNLDATATAISASPWAAAFSPSALRVLSQNRGTPSWSSPPQRGKALPAAVSSAVGRRSKAHRRDINSEQTSVKAPGNKQKPTAWTMSMASENLLSDFLLPSTREELRQCLCLLIRTSHPSAECPRPWPKLAKPLLWHLLLFLLNLLPGY